MSLRRKSGTVAPGSGADTFESEGVASARVQAVKTVRKDSTSSSSEVSTWPLERARPRWRTTGIRRLYPVRPDAESQAGVLRDSRAGEAADRRSRFSRRT